MRSMMTTNDKNISNILLVDKPKGISSYQVIRILQKKLGIKKMGHAGTLDPLATGLMLIGINEGTKKLTALLGLSKEYEAEILMGIKTDTADVDGKIIEEKQIPELSDEQIQATLLSMVGTLELAVPIYSAIKRQGKPLYEYARAGQEVSIPIKPMKVLSAEYIKKENNSIFVNFNVGSGTYIRSLAEEFAKRLETIATIKNLRRISIGEYSVRDAMKVD